MAARDGEQCNRDVAAILPPARPAAVLIGPAMPNVYGRGNQRFLDRRQAGEFLAAALAEYGGRDDVVVLAIPRGGVPVAARVAEALRAPLDVIVVRKLGFPGQEELAMGAIGPGAVRVLNPEVVAELGDPAAAIAEAVERELVELERRERAYRGGRPPAELTGRAVIIVDDGLATGSTMRAAIATAKAQGARAVVVAVPVAAESTRRALATECDRLVCLLSSDHFLGVGQWYADFSPTGDGEVIGILAAQRGAPAGIRRSAGGGRARRRPRRWLHRGGPSAP